MTQPAAPSADVPPRLDLRGIGLRFGAVRALADVSLQVRPGEILALLGDSGCGKSTLLRAIAGLEQPETGTIRLDGTLVSEDGRGVAPEARGVGLMFQDYALFPHLTVAENVRFGLHGKSLQGKSAAEARAIAQARLEQVGLADRARSYPGTLSGGESQRVALARALAPGPRVLLLDEPFSNLDRRTRDQVRDDTLAVLRASGATTLLVTHDPEEALGFADRIALMRRGRIVQVGTGLELYRRPATRFAARFFGDLVEIDGTCRAGILATPFGPVPAPGHAEGAAVTLCLRPEAIRLGAPGASLRAVVRARRFLGAAALLTVSAEGVPEPLRLPVPADDPREPGDTVGLSLDPAHGFIFASETD
ncbi:ABC transporter ATP-binding protein [Methylobacterium sp.]|jgi:iron(III) transport system ATP-binding protein|uniref:ABC transporter ATP-binding protein n=1 Tax=Methylobacterium sp. TaxID=409 RepID=UPI0026009AF1|nr:ABC transporter ATP-binding protein [Methylobacterium sp.]MBY0260609.1 ABC transporter ATP-binding protein [Methylobacterium sp.]